MKKLIIALTIAASFNTFAEEAKKDPLAICVTYQSVARSIMTARQSEVSISRMMEIMKGDDYGQSLVAAAYSQSAYKTKSIRDSKIESFANNTYLACYKAVMKGDK